MANRLLTADEFTTYVMDLAKEHAKGDPKLEMILLASLGAGMNGPDSPAAELLERLTKDQVS